MIFVSWVYKGTVVESHKIEKPYTMRNCQKVREDITAGKINVPDNFDRFTVTPTENLVGFWLG